MPPLRGAPGARRAPPQQVLRLRPREGLRSSELRASGTPSEPRTIHQGGGERGASDATTLPRRMPASLSLSQALKKPSAGHVQQVKLNLIHTPLTPLTHGGNLRKQPASWSQPPGGVPFGPGSTSQRLARARPPPKQGQQRRILILLGKPIRRRRGTCEGHLRAGAIGHFQSPRSKSAQCEPRASSASHRICGQGLVPLWVITG